jgi:hypothetical protein
MILFFKRILADIIDVLLFAFVYYLFSLISGLSNSTEHRVFFISITAIFVLYTPSFLIKNTVGKEILNLRWINSPEIRIKLFSKYLFYTILFLPSINPLSIFTSFPFYNQDVINIDKIFLFKLTLVYLVCDIVVFICSLGRYRIIDYFLNLKLVNEYYTKNTYRSLSIMLSFFTVLFISNVVQYRYEITFSEMAEKLVSKVSNESFPIDLIPGGAILSLHEMSTAVYVPSNPLTFIISKQLPIKTIYIYVPFEIFKSDILRRNTCYDVLKYSLRNDIYSDWITRIKWCQ